MHGLSYLEAPGFNRRVRSKIPDLGVDFGQRNNEEKLLEPSELELELELIQAHMAQKPMLRAEVYAHAMRASQNR